MPSPPIPIVLDTNTVMALWHFNDPALEALRNGIKHDQVTLYTREDALDELCHVLAYRQFAIPPDTQNTLLSEYRKRCTFVAAPGADALVLPKCRDRDDQKFLEITRDAGAAYLITRDKALLRLNRHQLIRALYQIQKPENWRVEAASPALVPGINPSITPSFLRS